MSHVRQTLFVHYSHPLCSLLEALLLTVARVAASAQNISDVVVSLVCYLKILSNLKKMLITGT